MSNALQMDYRNTFFESLSDLLKKELFFDVFILCKDDIMLGAHKVILGSASMFFKLKFVHEMSGMKPSIILMTDFESSIMKIIIKYIYSGSLLISEDTVQDLLVAADYIGLNFVVTECCEFLRLNFDPSNVIGIYNLANQMNCAGLKEKSNQFRNFRFLDVIKNEEFLEMSPDLLIEYLVSNDLHVESEQQVFEAALKWLLKNASRRDHFIAVMDTIRIPLLSHKFLNQFLKNCSDKWLKVFLKKYISDVTLPNGYQLSTIQKNVMYEKYISRKSIKKTAYIIGGHIPEIWSDVNTLSTIMSFDLTQLRSTSKFRHLDPMMNEARSGHCAAVVDRKVFLFGGEDNSIMLNSAECWEENDPCCNFLPPMLMQRVWASACSVANMIYIFGGLIDGAIIERKIDIFDTWTDTWQAPVTIPDNFNVCYGMGVIYAKGLIYLIGGINQYSKTEDQCLSFNPVTESFEKICSLQNPRNRFGISYLDDYIYVAGGSNEIILLSSVERYSLEEDKWELISPLLLPRSSLGMVAMDGELFVVGGESCSEHFCFIENYKPDKNIWIKVTCEPWSRKDFCVVVV